MFLSAQEIAQSREHTLNNFLSLSAAYFDASQLLSGVLADAGRESLQYGSKHLSGFEFVPLTTAGEISATAWLNNAARACRTLEEALKIIGDTHKTMIRCAEAQACILDEIAFASLRRATKTSPWEAALALNAMKSSLEGAEQTLHDLSRAAIQTVDLAEQDAHQLVDSMAGSPPAPRKRSVRRKPAS